MFWGNIKLPPLQMLAFADFAYTSHRTDAYTLMSMLSVDTYYIYRNDMRKFLAFGYVCNPAHNKTFPTLKNTSS